MAIAMIFLSSAKMIKLVDETKRSMGRGNIERFLLVCDDMKDNYNYLFTQTCFVGV